MFRRPMGQFQPRLTAFLHDDGFSHLAHTGA